jgi:NTE family protein
VAWGLALSGGGVLGAAHLGVLRAFRAWNLRPDTLAGTSAGGLVVGALAAGADLEDLVAYGARVAARPLEYLRPRLLRLAAELVPEDPWPPAESLLDSAPFVEGLVRLCRCRRIEDWRWPTAVTAVDLAALEAVAFLRPGRRLEPPIGRWRLVQGGDLRTALQATMAIPGLYTPVRSGGAFLVDGGIADTLPVDWAAALGASRVVAVDVAPPRPGLPPRAGILWSLGQSSAYVTCTLSRLRQPPALPVLRLLPDTRVPFPGFAQYRQLVEAGYEEATRRKEEILAFVAGGAEGGHPAGPETDARLTDGWRRPQPGPGAAAPPPGAARPPRGRPGG